MEPREHQWGDHQSASRRPNKALNTVEGDIPGLGKVRVGAEQGLHHHNSETAKEFLEVPRNE